MTCYEELMESIKNTPEAPLCMESFPEFAKRRHTKKEFDAWVRFSKWLLKTVRELEPLRHQPAGYTKAENHCFENFPEDLCTPTFRLRKGESLADIADSLGNPELYWAFKIAVALILPKP